MARLFWHFYGQRLLPELFEREVFKPIVGVVGAPGILHDEESVAVVIAGKAHNCHGVAFALPTDAVMASDGIDSPL